MSASLLHSSIAMRLGPDRRKFLVALAALLAGTGNIHADNQGDRDDDDHEQARRALEEGQVKPLTEILETVKNQIDGDVVGVEFEHKNGRYVYEFKVISASGRLHEIYVDAMTAEILEGEHD
jgi:uncharacterized membrane protein YkoI